MSTKMTGSDRAAVLAVFRHCLPRQGAKTKDDRLFPEALHFFVTHDITWRALPKRFGHWNRVWRRFHRLSRSGGFERDGVSGPDVRFDSDARMSRQRGQGLGRSRGGFSTKIHLKTDFDGLPVAFHLTGVRDLDGSWPRCPAPHHRCGQGLSQRQKP